MYNPVRHFSGYINVQNIENDNFQNARKIEVHPSPRHKQKWWTKIQLLYGVPMKIYLFGYVIVDEVIIVDNNYQPPITLGATNVNQFARIPN